MFVESNVRCCYDPQIVLCHVRSVDTRLGLVSLQMIYFLNPVTQAHPDPPELDLAGDGAGGKDIVIGKHVNSRFTYRGASIIVFKPGGPLKCLLLKFTDSCLLPFKTR